MNVARSSQATVRLETDNGLHVLGAASEDSSKRVSVRVHVLNIDFEQVCTERFHGQKRA